MVLWIRKQDPAPYETAELIVSGVIPIVLIVVGTFGNLLCAIILLNKENRKTSTNVYLIFLCTMDTLSLYQWNLNYIVYEFTDGKQQISNQSLFLCRCSQFLAFYTLHTSAMFLTFVELDRACLLRSTWYKRKVAKSRVALAFCIIILLVLFALNGFLFGLGFEYTTYDNSTGTQVTAVACYYSLDNSLNDFFANRYQWIHLVVMYVLPFTVIMFSTVLTAKKLIVTQIPTNDQLANSAQRNRRISLMLLLMCLTYIVCTLPNRLCFSVFASQIVGHDYTDTVFLSSNTLMYTRNAMNAFFLYASVYGFRRDIRNLVFSCLGKRSIQVAPNNIITKSYLATLSTVRGPINISVMALPRIND